MCVMRIKTKPNQLQNVFFLSVEFQGFSYNMYINADALKGVSVEVLLIIALNGKST